MGGREAGDPRANIAGVTKQDAIVRAEGAALAAGLLLSDYLPPRATRHGASWRVWSQMTPPTPPGGHLPVDVDDQTGEARVILGR